MSLPTSEAAARGAPAWYGKLAGLGDFAQRRLPAEWLQACDSWLSALMRSGPQLLGERWLEVYLTAPLLRFAWAPGVLDAQWWFGVLMPSCDSVGRYFPLLICQPRSRAPEDRIALDHLELWYRHLAQAAIATLDGRDDTVDRLEASLQDCPPWPTPGRRQVLAARPAPPGERLQLAHGAHLADCLHALATLAVAQRLAGCTLWWRVSDEGDAADSLQIVSGLPDAAGFVRLLEEPDATG